MGTLNKSRTWRPWTLTDTYGFIASYLAVPSGRRYVSQRTQSSLQSLQHCHYTPYIRRNGSFGIDKSSQLKLEQNISCRYLHLARGSSANQHFQRRHFHNYFVTHLPSTSLHPDSRYSTAPHHKLPREASIPHDPRLGPPPTAAPPMLGIPRDLTVVRIPIRSAKHHFGASISRGSRPYNEDTFQAGTIDIPAFAKRAPMSLNMVDVAARAKEGGATSADSASGDPQVFYFAVFDGHGGVDCSEFLQQELHHYIEKAAVQFGLQSSLRNGAKSLDKSKLVSAVPDLVAGNGLPAKNRRALDAIDMKSEDEVKNQTPTKEQLEDHPLTAPRAKSEEPLPQLMNEPKARELEASLVDEWRHTVGGYFRRFKPDYFELPPKQKPGLPAMSSISSKRSPPSIETVLMYAFLRCDLDFVIAQASKHDPEAVDDYPLNDDEILGRPSAILTQNQIGGPTRFKGGSTASIAMISTPSPQPFWHPSSPSTLLVAHVGDTRILLCETSTGLAVPTTTNHHPSSPIESSRLRRYAATFVTDSFGEERMSGLANTRAFGDMLSKRIGVSAEPEIVRVALAPAQYSFVVLMSDGVSGTLTDQEIVDIVKEAKTPEQGAQDVVTFATEVSKDGDNATCLVVRLGGWERRGEGGLGSLGTKEMRDFRKQEATDPRRNRR